MLGLSAGEGLGAGREGREASESGEGDGGGECNWDSDEGGADAKGS